MAEYKHNPKKAGGTHVRIHGKDEFLGTVNFNRDPDDIMANVSRLAQSGSHVVHKEPCVVSEPGSTPGGICCAHKYCSAAAVYHTMIMVGGIPLCISLCEEHATEWDMEYRTVL